MLPTLSRFDADDQALLKPSPAGGLIIYRISARISCSNPHAPHILAVNRYSQTALIYGAACGLWSCPECAQRNQRRWVFRAVNGANGALQQGRKVSFITITPHERLSPAATRIVLPRAWHNLRNRLDRTPGDVEYLLVPEPHKSGKLHLHGLFIDAPDRRKWWKDNARACGFGYQADLKEVERVGGVAAYIGKYISKSLVNANLPKRFHRVRASNGFPTLPQTERDDGWETLALKPDQVLQEVADIWRAQGFNVVFTDSESAYAAYSVFGEWY